MLICILFGADWIKLINIKRLQSFWFSPWRPELLKGGVQANDQKNDLDLFRGSIIADGFGFMCRCLITFATLAFISKFYLVFEDKCIEKALYYRDQVNFNAVF